MLPLSTLDRTCMSTARLELVEDIMWTSQIDVMGHSMHNIANDKFGRELQLALGRLQA